MLRDPQHREADSALARSPCRSPCLPRWVLLVLCSERHVGCGGDGWGLRGDSRGRREGLRRGRSTVGGRRVWKQIQFPVARKLISKPQVVAEVVATSQLAHWRGPGTLLKCFQSRLLCHIQASSQPWAAGRHWWFHLPWPCGGRRCQQGAGAVAQPRWGLLCPAGPSPWQRGSISSVLDLPIQMLISSRSSLMETTEIKFASQLGTPEPSQVDTCNQPPEQNWFACTSHSVTEDI